MHLIEIGSVKIRVPSNVKQIEAGHVPAFLMALTSEQLPNQKKYDLLMAWCNPIQQRAINRINKVQLAQILTTLDWIESPNLTKPLLPTFKQKGETFIAPEELMASSSIVEWIFAETYAKGIKEDINQLFYVLAVLYRPQKKRKKKGDLREKFDTDTLEERAEQFKTLPMYIPLSAFHFYMATVQEIRDRYHILFPPPVKDEKTGEYLTPPESNFDWWDCLLSIAETGTFGDFEQVKFTNMHEIFRYLTKKQKERNEEKQKRNATRNP